MRNAALDEMITGMFEMVGAVADGAVGLIPTSRQIMEKLSPLTVAAVTSISATLPLTAVITTQIYDESRFSATEDSMETSEGRLKWLGLDESSEESTWLGALDFLRARGRDPEAVLAMAGENVVRLHRVGMDDVLPDPLFAESRAGRRKT